MNNFANEEIANLIVLVRAGFKAMPELNGTQMIVVGALIKKLEDLIKPPQETKEPAKVEEPTIAKTKKPTRGTALVN